VCLETDALAFSKSTGLDCRRIQFTPDTMASDIVVYSVYNKQNGKFEYLPGAVLNTQLMRIMSFYVDKKNVFCTKIA